MLLSLVIPTLNRPKSLSLCLNSIDASDCPPEEIIIIDQSDSDETEKVVSERRSSISRKGTCIVYQKVEFKSSTRSRNMGLAISKGDIVMFSDDDVEFQQGNFRYVRSSFESGNLALLGAFNSLDPKPKQSWWGYFFDFREFNPSGKGYITKSCLGNIPQKKNAPISTDWAMGYCFVIKKAIAQDHHIDFDEKMTGYAFNEDLDFTSKYCKIAKDIGLCCKYDPDFSVFHRETKEYRVPTPIFYLSWMGNRYYILKKWKRKNFIPFYLSILGLFLLLLIKDRNKFSSFKKAKKVFSANKKAIGNGELLYYRWVKK